jgi:hypothetical protein
MLVYDPFRSIDDYYSLVKSENLFDELIIAPSNMSYLNFSNYEITNIERIFESCKTKFKNLIMHFMHSPQMKKMTRFLMTIVWQNLCNSPKMFEEYKNIDSYFVVKQHIDNIYPPKIYRSNVRKLKKHYIKTHNLSLVDIHKTLQNMFCNYRKIITKNSTIVDKYFAVILNMNEITAQDIQFTLEDIKM